MAITRNVRAAAATAAAFLLSTTAGSILAPTPAAAQTGPAVSQPRTLNGVTVQRFPDGNVLTANGETLFFHEGTPGDVDYIVMTRAGQRPQTLRRGTREFDDAANRGIAYLQQAGIIPAAGSAGPGTAGPQYAPQPDAQVAAPINFGNAGAEAEENGVIIRQYTGGVLIVNGNSGDAIFVSSIDGRVGRGTTTRDGTSIEPYALGDPRAVTALTTAQSYVQIFGQQQSVTLGTSSSTRRIAGTIDRDLGRAVGDAQRFERDRQQIDRLNDRPFAQLASRAIGNARTANNRAASLARANRTGGTVTGGGTGVQDRAAEAARRRAAQQIVSSSRTQDDYVCESPQTGETGVCVRNGYTVTFNPIRMQ